LGPFRFPYHQTIPALVTFDSGSHGCGGADASIEAACGKVHIDKLTSPLFQFLVPLAKLARELGLGEEIDDMSNKLLIEENVRRQVHNIVNSDTIQKRSENGTCFSYSDKEPPLTHPHRNSDRAWMDIQPPHWLR